MTSRWVTSVANLNEPSNQTDARAVRPRGSDSTRRPAGGALGTSSVVLQFTSSPAEGAEGWGWGGAISRDQQGGGGAGLQEFNGETCQRKTDRRLTVHRSHSSRLIRCLSCGRRDKGSGGSSSPEWSNQDSKTGHRQRRSYWSLSDTRTVILFFSLKSVTKKTSIKTDSEYQWSFN